MDCSHSSCCSLRSSSGTCSHRTGDDNHLNDVLNDNHDDDLNDKLDDNLNNYDDDDIENVILGSLLPMEHC